MDGAARRRDVRGGARRRSRRRGRACRARQRDRDAVPSYDPPSQLAAGQGDGGALGDRRLPPTLRARAGRDVVARDSGGRRDARRTGDGGNSLHDPGAAPGGARAGGGGPPPAPPPRPPPPPPLSLLQPPLPPPPPPAARARS